MILQALFLTLTTLSSGASSLYQYSAQVVTSASYTLTFDNDTFVKNDIEFTFKLSYNNDEDYRLELFKYNITSTSYNDEGDVYGSPSVASYTFSEYIVFQPYTQSIVVNESLDDTEIDFRITVAGTNEVLLSTSPAGLNGSSLITNFDPVVQFDNVEWSTIIRSSNYYQSGSADYDNGYNVGYTEGSQAGYQSGYTDGYQEGAVQDETAVVIFNGIINVALLPVNVFLQILNFEVFGINFGGLASAFLTIAIVIIIVRIITGKKNSE